MRTGHYGAIALPVLLCSLLILSSCGYRMAGTGSHLPAGTKSIFIPVFENKTMEPIMEEELTPAVIREFIRDGRIEVADSSRADMVLKGSVVSYQETPVSFDASENVLEYRISITTHLILGKARGGRSDKPVWERDISTTAEYIVSNDVMTTRISKLSALREIARNLSEEVADRLIMGW